MDVYTKELMERLRRYKFLNRLTNPILGDRLQVCGTWVSNMINFKVTPCDSLRYRIEDLLGTWEEQKGINYKSKNQPCQPSVDKNKPTKVVVNAKVKKKLIDKVAHVKPHKKRSR